MAFRRRRYVSRRRVGARRVFGRSRRRGGAGLRRIGYRM